MFPTAHFTLTELTHSDTAARNGLNNAPDSVAFDNLYRLATTLLDPIRDIVGNPVVVTSGYRGPRLNKMIGGARNSAHMFGRAADIKCPAMHVVDLYRTIIANKDKLPYDKAILEFRNWVHIQVPAPAGEPKHQDLEAVHASGKVRYILWGAE